MRVLLQEQSDGEQCFRQCLRDNMNVEMSGRSNAYGMLMLINCASTQKGIDETAIAGSVAGITASLWRAESVL